MSTEFEQHLRDRLRRAAETAPSQPGLLRQIEAGTVSDALPGLPHRTRLRRWLPLLASAAIALTAATAIALASVANHRSAPPGVGASLSCGVLPQACRLSAPPAGHASDQEAHPLPKGATLLTRSQAEAHAVGANHITSRTFSALMTGAQADARFEVGRASSYDETRPVWVVTVHASVGTDGGPGARPTRKDVYSIVLDAHTGRITDACTGCAWLTASL